MIKIKDIETMTVPELRQTVSELGYSAADVIIKELCEIELEERVLGKVRKLDNQEQALDACVQRLTGGEIQLFKGGLTAVEGSRRVTCEMNAQQDLFA